MLLTLTAKSWVHTGMKQCFSIYGEHFLPSDHPYQANTHLHQNTVSTELWFFYPVVSKNFTSARTVLLLQIQLYAEILSLYPQSSFHCRKPSCFTSTTSTHLYTYPLSVIHNLRQILIGTHPSNGLLFHQIQLWAPATLPPKKKCQTCIELESVEAPMSVCKLWTETYLLTLPKIVRTTQLYSPRSKY